MRIAILEDDVHVGQLMSLWLEQAGHDGQLFATGEAFRKALVRESFDLLILDRTLPDTSGDIELAWVRGYVDWPIPVIFVTVSDTEEEIVKGLANGADDYMVKPVRERELLARIAAVARRSQQAGEGREKEKLEFPPYVIDLAAHVLTVNGQAVELTHKEFELVVFLFRNAGRMLSRGHILESVWGRTAEQNTRTVDTHISRIRVKLGLAPENGWRLTAVYHYGYRLEHLD